MVVHVQAVGEAADLLEACRRSTSRSGCGRASPRSMSVAATQRRQLLVDRLFEFLDGVTGTGGGFDLEHRPERQRVLRGRDVLSDLLSRRPASCTGGWSDRRPGWSPSMSASASPGLKIGGVIHAMYTRGSSTREGTTLRRSAVIRGVSTLTVGTAGPRLSVPKYFSISFFAWRARCRRRWRGSRCSARSTA